MSIPYSLTVRLVRPSKPEMGNKTYAVAQYARIMDLNALAEHMSSHDSKYNKGDILAILSQMASCIREQLLLGNKVVLDDMGAFSLVLRSTGAEDAESFSTSMIQKVMVRWTPSAKLENLVNDAQFHFAGSRKSQQEARVAERERLKAMASGSSDTEDPDDSGEDLGE